MDKLIKAVVGILPKKLQDIYYKYEDKWLYLFFGVLTTAVSFVTAGISKSAVEKMGMSTAWVSGISTVFSWICAVTFAYVTNRLWVFESKVTNKQELLTEAASFYGGRLFTLAVEFVMMLVGYSVIASHIFADNEKTLSASYWVVKIIANVVVLILNYVISKLFVFKNKDEKKPETAPSDANE